MFHPSPRVTTAAPYRRSPCLSDPGLAGVAAPLLWKRFVGQGDTGSGDFHGRERCPRTSPGAQARVLPLCAGSAGRTELRDSPPGHRGRSRRLSGPDWGDRGEQAAPHGHREKLEAVPKGGEPYRDSGLPVRSGCPSSGCPGRSYPARRLPRGRLAGPWRSARSCGEICASMPKPRC